MSQSVHAAAVESLSIPRPAAPAARRAPERERVRDEATGAAALLETTKPRITRLVTVTSGVGFALATLVGADFAAGWGGWGQLGAMALPAAGALAGTALSAAGANALNQWMERRRDALMPRTSTRPLPEGRLAPRTVLAAGTGLAGLGVLVLLAACGPVPAAVSLATVLLYVLVYTPLKPVTPLATVVGAVPGALPPVIGWTAATGGWGGEGWHSLTAPGAWALFGIMFVWQIPHFLAIAWMYREDYAAGGYRVLPVVDASGRRTARSILAWSLVLVPVTAAPALLMSRAPGSLYAIIAAAMGLGFFGLSLRLAQTRARADARKAFLASIVHLPLVMATLVAFMVLSKALF